MTVRQALYTPLGFGTFSVDATTAKTLNSAAAAGSNIDTVEAVVGGIAAKKALQVEIVPEGAIRFRLDGVAPTATVGVPVPAGAQYVITSDPRKFQFISQSGTVTVNASFLGD